MAHNEIPIICAMCETEDDLRQCADCGDILCGECSGDGDCRAEDYAKPA